ncbi:glycosyltransferase family 2 protein [Methylophaga pinxianii]|uniref:glycosyltransferase family 2 protein n=1 Tax=Methylophaga pinxianii TaxID=2881052 RepID=UPI001CF23F38|nr:glycosyltransferase family 2 protein [Methylophaga pinxianii]MCB2425568.1 glycosyltransferase family 2 protein [Methylophaga pinxianii]UPH47141.1 glycosyltransferase family 2 protein [Methylophaga pinxianii]
MIDFQYTAVPSESPTTPHKIAVLMCTYNGAAHLAEQKDSIDAQGLNNIDIWVSDDGSSDNTIEILKKYQAYCNKGRFEVLQGPQRGFCKNFLSLVYDPRIDADFYAFSDQDDVWEPDKLTRALGFLKTHSDEPALYCSRTTLIAECGKYLNRKSPLFSRPPSFANALVQNIAGGNTMVLNKKAHELLCMAGKQKIVSHDWWAYLLVTGAGGCVFYDKVPSVKYRQHDHNEIGANMGFLAKLKRLIFLIKGSFSDWNTLHIQSLGSIEELLHPQSQKTLIEFTQARNSGLIKRFIILKKSRLYRQTPEGNIALWMAAILKKI